MTARSSPPPRKSGRKSTEPPPRPLRAIDKGDEVGVDVEVSGPTLASPGVGGGGDDDDATKGEWLFKQDEMVLGPVTAIVLVERIKVGELSSDTPIARDGQPFKPMKLVPLFREAYEATLERKRRVAEERAYNAAVRRSSILKVLLFSLIVLVPAVAGAVAGRMVMILQPWDKTSEWIAKAPPLVDLPPKPPEIVKKEAPPVVAENDHNDSEDNAEPEKNPKGPHHASIRHDVKGPKDDKKDDKKDEKKDEGKDQGFVKELTNEQAIAPLKDSSVRGGLGACFKAEVEGNPDMPTPLNLSYTITEDGRAANVEITNREERGRPLQDCVKKALSAARWPRFEGERKNVAVPFNIKKPPKPATASGPVTGGPK